MVVSDCGREMKTQRQRPVKFTFCKGRWKIISPKNFSDKYAVQSTERRNKSCNDSTHLKNSALRRIRHACSVFNKIEQANTTATSIYVIDYGCRFIAPYYSFSSSKCWQYSILRIPRSLIQVRKLKWHFFTLISLSDRHNVILHSWHVHYKRVEKNIATLRITSRQITNRISSP